MAPPRKDLSSQVQYIVSDTLERVKVLVKDSLSKELAHLIGGGLIGGTGLGRRAGRKPGPKPGRRASLVKVTSPGRGGRRATVVTEKRVSALAALVDSRGEIAPKEARKALKLSVPHLQAVAKAAQSAGKIKVTGGGRGTRYVKG